MIIMKSRYQIDDVSIKVINMSPKDAASYVLIKTSDESGNEISFSMTNEQADRLELELYEANKRTRVIFNINSPSFH
jgi:hypothetical protein